MNKYTKLYLLIVASLMLTILTVASCNAQSTQIELYNSYFNSTEKIEKVKTPKTSHFFVWGLDIANAVYGGTVNSVALNYQIGYLLKSNRENVEVGLLYEHFPKLNFNQFTMVVNKVLHLNKKIEFTTGFEHGTIRRWKGYLHKVEGSDAFYYVFGGNLEARYKLTKNMKVSFQFNLIKRMDINKWIGNNTLNLIIEL